jgi:DNA-binding CsgD family transcriptional regulator
MTDAPPPERADAPALSHRDIEALGLLAEGRSIAQIAATMSISRNTVRTRIRRLRAKLGVVDLQQVLPRARSHELHQLPHDDAVATGRGPSAGVGKPVPNGSGRGQDDFPRRAGERS